MMYVDDGGLVRFEAENATAVGDVYKIQSSIASGGAFMKSQDGWTLTFSNIKMAADGDYLVSIRYQLTFGSPKTQSLVINGDTFTNVEFTAPDISAWLQRGLMVPLKAGINEIAIQGLWNWMSLDYIAVEGVRGGRG